MNKSDLTILIPCSDDTRIKHCIQSIYKTYKQDIEIIISLNKPTKSIKDILKEFPMVKTCEIQERNLAKAYNNGIKNSSRNNIFLMDSDCIFTKNTIELLYEGLKYSKLSKGLVVFKSNSFMSNIISKVREYTTTDFINAYSPPLIFSKDIKNLIGGYYFHEQVFWSEDSEFNYRIQKAGLKIYHNPKAIIYHEPLNIKQDMKSGFKCGRGKKIGEALGLLPKTNYFSFLTFSKKFIKTYEVLQKKGLLPAVYYLFIWRLTNRLGYIFQGLIYKINR